MGDKSAIEWTDASWTPIRARNLKTGKIGWHCEHATSGCEFCYAEGMNTRLGTGLPFKPGHRKDIEIFLDEKMLGAPLHWKRRRMVFVCSMTDLFADFVKDEWIYSIFETMLETEHTYQILTKRPERMNRWIRSFLAPALTERILENIWLGTSCEDQASFDEREPHLRATPAIIRFFSFEPLLGHIDASSALATSRFHWAIVGGESGPKARPMHIEWARSLRDQCITANVAFFFKQWGEWWDAADGGPAEFRGTKDEDNRLVRLGKKLAGRSLDGREHNEFPT